MTDCGYRDRAWHGSRECDETCRGSAYWRVNWMWGLEHGEIKVASVEQAWTVAHDYLTRGYGVSFSLALADHLKGATP